MGERKENLHRQSVMGKKPKDEQLIRSMETDEMEANQIDLYMMMQV